MFRRVCLARPSRLVKALLSKAVQAENIFYMKVEEYGLFRKGQKIYVAVSVENDSTVDGGWVGLGKWI